MRKVRTCGLLTYLLAPVIIFLLCAGTAIPSPAQTFTSLLTFEGTNGAGPYLMSLVQGFDGNLYGTTAAGGAYGAGTVFKITSGGELTVLHSFCANCPDGDGPADRLLLAANGDFYGTTINGGAHSLGTVFKISPSGTLSILHSFCAQRKSGRCADGTNPVGGLVLAANGSFYGTTGTSGINGGGTVFKITPSGTLTTLYSFCAQANCADGKSPNGGLVLASSGNFYGMTSSGGINGRGTVFKITLSGGLTTLYKFCAQSGCTDGASPQSGLVQANAGSFYGATDYGGANCGPQGGCGTVFKITPSGTLTTLYSFCAQGNCGDGSIPIAAPFQATDGNFYGTTLLGGSSNNCGSNGCGTVFKITPSGTLTTLHTFDGTDGTKPSSGLLQATNGKFYGTTAEGGDFSCPANPSFGCGTIFSLSTGLRPFVSLLPYSGKVGTVVYILGTNLKGASSVSFNGTAATFTVVSSTEIKTTVPSGAATGFVTVTTPSGTLKSNKKFRVTL